jgi:Ca-activated chloride channel homolog
MKVRNRIAQVGLMVMLACIGLPTFAQQKPQPMPSEPRATIQLNTELISLSVAVTDRQGRAVAGLEREAFSVFEDGVKQEISFLRHEDEPASVVVVFDTSGSMTEHKIELAREALAQFVAASHSEDEYSLIAFNQQAHLLLDRVRDSELLLRRAGSLKPGGATALYDAVAVGLEQLTKSAHSKRALIVLSDGADNRSRLQLAQLRRLVEESDSLLYAVGTLPQSAAKPIVGQMRAGFALERIAEASGGRAFFPSYGEQLINVFTQIALELRQQYSLGYTPSNFIADGKWRKIKVEVTAPDAQRLSVRSRRGYYAIPRDARRGAVAGGD